MPKWIDIANEKDLKPGAFKVAEIDDISIIVFNLDGNYYAIEDVCTHDGGILSEGDIESCMDKGEIVCPRHGARFDIRTGEVMAPPAYEDLPTFPVRVENGVVQVQS